MSIKFGVSFWIWTGPFSMQEHMWFPSRAKALGADAIEIPMEIDTEIDPRILRSILASEGLEFSAGCACGPGPGMFDADMNERNHWTNFLKGKIDFLAEAGSATLITVLGGIGESRRIPPEEYESLYKRASDSFRPVAEHAADTGMRVAIETINRYESNILTKTREALRFLDEVDNPAAGLLLDTFHMNIEETNPADAIRLAGGKLFYLHCTENDRGTPGRGSVPWHDIGIALRQIQYAGPAVIEVMNYGTPIGDACSIWQPWDFTPDQGAQDALTFLRSTFATSNT